METFKNIPISIMLNKSLVGKAPSDWESSDWRNYYRSFKHTKLTPHVFAAMVWQGYSFTPVYKNGRRIENNFSAAYHMAFDFDEDGADLDFLMREGTLANMLSGFAYSTPSSTPEHPKSRVVFIIPEGINDPTTFRELYQAIAAEFEREGSKTDPSCKDPLRLYYGSLNCDMRTNWSALLPENINLLLERYEEENPLPIITPNNTIVTELADQSHIQYRMDNEMSKIISAPDGEKHRTLNKSAFTVGGFVGGGHLSEFDAISQLKSAIDANGRVDNKEAAYRTIEEGVRRGAAKPLVIEERIKKPLSERLQ